MAGGYKTLEAGKRYLKNLGSLAVDPQDGITQADLDAAEAAAKNRIDAALATVYDISGWAASPPPFIAEIADKLASAGVLVFKFARDGGGASGLANVLEDTANRDIEMVARHEIALVDSNGNRIVPLARRRPVVNCDGDS